MSICCPFYRPVQSIFFQTTLRSIQTGDPACRLLHDSLSLSVIPYRIDRLTSELQRVIAPLVQVTKRFVLRFRRKSIKGSFSLVRWSVRSARTWPTGQYMVVATALLKGEYLGRLGTHLGSLDSRSEQQDFEVEVDRDHHSVA
jgi:hypothetical protein